MSTELYYKSRKLVQEHCQKIFADFGPEDSEEILCAFIAAYTAELCCHLCRSSKGGGHCATSEKEMAMRLYHLADAWAVRDVPGMMGEALTSPRPLRRGNLKTDGTQ